MIKTHCTTIHLLPWGGTAFCNSTIRTKEQVLCIGHFHFFRVRSKSWYNYYSVFNKFEYINIRSTCQNIALMSNSTCSDLHIVHISDPQLKYPRQFHLQDRWSCFIRLSDYLVTMEYTLKKWSPLSGLLHLSFTNRASRYKRPREHFQTLPLLRGTAQGICVTKHVSCIFRGQLSSQLFENTKIEF